MNSPSNTFEGGAYIASGTFKCLFDHDDKIQFVDRENGDVFREMRCGQGNVVIISEKEEFDKEESFSKILLPTFDKRTICLPLALYFFLQSGTPRYTLSEDGIESFRKIANQKSSTNCKKLFQKPRTLQAVCLAQGVPLTGDELVFIIWSKFGKGKDFTPTKFAPLLAEYLTNVALGLKVLLDVELCHADVKTNNVLLFERPRPIRRYEIEPNTIKLEGELDQVGRRAYYQLVDFGKYKTKQNFIEGQFRAFTRKSIRLWYNPLCLGLYLLDQSSEIDAPQLSVSSSEYRSNWKPLLNQTYQRWITPLFDQMDKYAFMWLIWEAAKSLHKVEQEKLETSLYQLIQDCALPLPDPILEQAAKRLNQETWLKDHPFRIFMLERQLFWFGSWAFIYRRIFTWSRRHNRKRTKILIPETIEQLASYLCPSLPVLKKRK